MLIGILKCGQVPDEIGRKYGDYGWMFETLLSDRGLEFRTYDVENMGFPDSVSDCEGWLITGSKWGVYDDKPFIAPLEQFIRDAHARGIPMVGICFGHQIIASALGGKVEKFDKGWSVGRTIYEGEDGPLALNAWHQDQVVEPPAEARTTASSDFCAHAALTYPGGIWTIQPHPEFRADIFGDFLKVRGEAAGVPGPILSDAIMKLPQPTDDAATADRIARHFHAHARVPHG